METVPETTTKEPNVASETTTEQERDAETFVSADGRVPYDILMLSEIYGVGHRGAVAGVPIESGTLIHMEAAAAYVVSPGYDDADKNAFYAADQYDRIPLELQAIPSSDAIVLTCILIEKKPDKARLLSDPHKGLHGRIQLNGEGTSIMEAAYDYFCSRCPSLVAAPSEATAPPSPVEEETKEKGDPEKWTKEQFTRLFAVVSLNAVRGTVPMSSISFGTGIYMATSFFNHACSPNAVAIYLPGKVSVHAIRDIRVGDEITVAYTECPRDLLSEDLVSMMHYQVGVLSTERGLCRCAMCADIRKALPLKGEEGEEVVNVDLEHFLSERTRERLNCDSELKNAFLVMFRDPLSLDAKKAAYVLFDKFSHLLITPNVDAAGQPLTTDAIEAMHQDVLPDLAYILGDLYCTTTIHLPTQDPRVLRFWADVYLAALTRSSVDMPRNLETAVIARVHAFLYQAGTVLDSDVEGRKKGIEDALEAWIVYKNLHMSIYGHSAYTVRVCKAFPHLEALAIECAPAIRARETVIALEQSRLAAEEQKKIDEENDRRIKEAEEALANGTATVAEEF